MNTKPPEECSRADVNQLSAKQARQLVSNLVAYARLQAHRALDFERRQRSEMTGEKIPVRSAKRNALILRCEAYGYMKSARKVKEALFGDTFDVCGVDAKKPYISLGNYFFNVESIADGVPVNPTLPEDFSQTDNQTRPEEHMIWWGVPYIETETSADPAWVAHWGGNTRYDVRCLDGGAWDRPTCWGMHKSLDEAIACAKAGPRWMKGVAA